MASGDRRKAHRNEVFSPSLQQQPKRIGDRQHFCFLGSTLSLSPRPGALELWFAVKPTPGKKVLARRDDADVIPIRKKSFGADVQDSGGATIRKSWSPSSHSQQAALQRAASRCIDREGTTSCANRRVSHSALPAPARKGLKCVCVCVFQRWRFELGLQRCSLVLFMLEIDIQWQALSLSLSISFSQAPEYRLLLVVDGRPPSRSLYHCLLGCLVVAPQVWQPDRSIVG